MIGLGHSLTLALAPQGVMGAGFDPLTLPTLSEWFDYRTLLETSNGDPVDEWAGRMGLYTLTAVAGTARPTFVADDGDGKAALQFDGVDDVMKVSSLIDNYTLYGTTGDTEVWIVLRADPTPATGGMIFCTIGATNQVLLDYNSSNVSRWCFPHGTEAASFSGLIDNAWHVLRFTKTGGHRSIQIDGATIHDSTSSAGTYTTGPDAFILGCVDFEPGLMGGVRHWMSFTSPLDDATAASLNTYLQSA